jgi:antitoxin YefM
MHDVVVNDEPLVVTRKCAEPMVVLSKSEFDAMERTNYLLSGENGRVLRERIAELNAGNGRLGKMIEDDDVRHNAA